MKANDYQEQAYKYAVYKHADYPFLALAEEVGEVMGKLAKYSRKNNLTLGVCIGEAKYAIDLVDKTLRDDLKKELGDVIWQLSACCKELGMTLEEVMQYNLDKLEGREGRGTLVGEGDNR